MSTEHKQADHQPFLAYSDEDIPTSHRTTSANVQSRRSTLFSHSLVLVLTSLFWVLVFYFNIPTQTPTTNTTSSPTNARHNITSSASLIGCGNTTAEARSLNCTFDILMNHWIPAPCLDTEFIAEYQDDGSWGAFYDANMTQKVETIEEMSEMEFYYTSVQDHINHCAEMWRKQFYVLFEELRAFDSIVASPGHTDHCAGYLAHAPGRNITESTKVEVGFAGCWIKN